MSKKCILIGKLLLYFILLLYFTPIGLRLQLVTIQRYLQIKYDPIGKLIILTCFGISLYPSELDYFSHFFNTLFKFDPLNFLYLISYLEHILSIKCHTLKNVVFISPTLIYLLYVLNASSIS